MSGGPHSAGAPLWCLQRIRDAWRPGSLSWLGRSPSTPWPCFSVGWLHSGDWVSPHGGSWHCELPKGSKKAFSLQSYGSSSGSQLHGLSLTWFGSQAHPCTVPVARCVWHSEGPVPGLELRHGSVQSTPYKDKATKSREVTCSRTIMPLLPKERTTVFTGKCDNPCQPLRPCQSLLLASISPVISICPLSPSSSFPCLRDTANSRFACLPTSTPSCLLLTLFSGPLSLSAYSTVVPFLMTCCISWKSIW